MQKMAGEQVLLCSLMQTVLGVLCWVQTVLSVMLLEVVVLEKARDPHPAADCCFVNRKAGGDRACVLVRLMGSAQKVGLLWCCDPCWDVRGVRERGEKVGQHSVRVRQLLLES